MRFDRKLKVSEYQIFNTPMEVDRWVNLYYTDEDLESLSMRKNMDSPLADYKGNSSFRINTLIRKGYSENTDLFDIPKLQTLLMRYKIPQNIVVYRFVDIKELLILHYNTLFGRTYAYPGFLSTTLLKEQYSMDYIKNGHVALKIIVDKGCSGAYLPEVVAENPEYEILFAHHAFIKRLGWTSFRITKV